jgi:hypothetical protein
MDRSVLIFLPWIFLPPMEKNAFCAVSMAGFGVHIFVRPPAKHWRTNGDAVPAASVWQFSQVASQML